MRKMKMTETVGAHISLCDDLVAKHQLSRQVPAGRESREGFCFDLICSSDLRSGQINS